MKKETNIVGREKELNELHRYFEPIISTQKRNIL